ncbi:DUF4168 domain-containing protein [Vibrio sp. V27_P1S3P104]|nr:MULTISPECIES: DUF4168 domain-containing protein [unclassified Vibrio]NAW67828.1 DUF4168 domain-containing protein [Vibrio sp. V28_P6S34P95]NAX38692.1 DUF4168 domain-containing protein [Vibrio sp. V27_P1S3P104]NNN46093.1 DUF4168 domain-containing protein [Vibrio sp. 1-1(7)]NNN73841.1 DUF4168 domain-containing protein [Vibrio sp. 12-2(3-a)]
MKKLSLALLMASFGMTSFLSPALAENQTPPNESAQQSQSSFKVTDNELRDFVVASKVVDSIRKEAVERLNGDVDEETARIIQQQATENMIKAVEKTGLSVDMYNRIAQAIHSDENLRQRANGLN